MTTLVIILLLSCTLSIQAGNSTNGTAEKRQEKYNRKRLLNVTNVEIEHHLINSTGYRITTSLLKQKANSGQLYIDLKQRGWKFLFHTGIELKGKKKHSYNLFRQVIKKRVGSSVMRDFNAIQSFKLKQPEQDNPVFEVSLLANGIRVDIFPEFCEEGCVSQQALSIKL